MTEQLYLFVNICFIITIVLTIIGTYLSNPFKYPHVTVDFDISGKRQPVYEDYVDEWINNLPNHRQSIKDTYDRVLNSWDSGCKYYLDHCLIWKSRRTALYESMRDIIIQNDYKMFEFTFSRDQTRYRQQNYERYAYIVQNTDNVLTFTLAEMLIIGDELEQIDYETTRTKYYAKNQRKLMTKELREKIKKRDNYTCQCCGFTENLQAHHIENYADNENLRTDIDNGITLCEGCHAVYSMGSFHNIFGTRHNTRKQLELYLSKYGKIRKAIQDILKEDM